MLRRAYLTAKEHICRKPDCKPYCLRDFGTECKHPSTFRWAVIEEIEKVYPAFGRFQLRHHYRYFACEHLVRIDDVIRWIMEERGLEVARSVERKLCERDAIVR